MPPCHRSAECRNPRRISHQHSPRRGRPRGTAGASPCRRPRSPADCRTSDARTSGAAPSTGACSLRPAARSCRARGRSADSRDPHTPSAGSVSSRLAVAADVWRRHRVGEVAALGERRDEPHAILNPVALHDAHARAPVVGPPQVLRPVVIRIGDRHRRACIRSPPGDLGTCRAPRRGPSRSRRRDSAHR